MGLLAVNLALATVRAQADATTASLLSTTRAIKDFPTIDYGDDARTVNGAESTAPQLQGFRSGGRSVGQPAAEATATDESRRGDGEPSLIQQLGQQDLIAKLLSSGVGPYLQEYIKLYMEQLTKGFGLDPYRARVIDEALHAQKIGAESIIKTFGGGVGQKFSFAQLEAELKRIFAAQQETQRMIRKGQSPKGPTSGTLGTATTPSPSGSLTLSLFSGALR